MPTTTWWRSGGLWHSLRCSSPASAYLRAYALPGGRLAVVTAVPDWSSPIPWALRASVHVLHVTPRTLRKGRVVDQVLQGIPRHRPRREKLGQVLWLLTADAELSTAQLADELCCSVAGTRVVLADLVELGLIRQTDRVRPGGRVWALSELEEDLARPGLLEVA